MNHKSADCRVAKDRYCNKCGHLGHFAVMCRTRLPKNGQKLWKPNSNSHRVYKLSEPDQYSENNYPPQESYQDESDDECIFALENKMSSQKVTLVYGKTPNSY